MNPTLRSLRKRTIGLTALSLLAMPMVAFAPSAAADHDFCLTNLHFMGGTVSGTVSAGAPYDVWQLVVPLGAHLVLQPSGGDADLAVMETQSCRVFFCHSINGGENQDTCDLLPGEYAVIVEYFFGESGSVGYTLFW